MGTNKRYADAIDARAERRRPSAPSPVDPPPWQRLNAFPNRWICRNGRWGTIYGEIEAQDVMRNMLMTTVFHAWSITESTRTDVGEFPTGDAASIELWRIFQDNIPRANPSQDRSNR